MRAMAIIGILPVDGVASIVHAERRGWWGEGIQARTVVFESAEARNDALARDEVDIAFMDGLTVALLRDHGLDAKILTALHRGTKNVLAAPGLPIQSLADLREVAVSLGTTIEYYADKMLERASVDPAQVVKRDVPSITERLERLLRGELLAACLPMPFAQMAQDRGARLLATNHGLQPPMLESVVAARGDWLAGRREDARRFLRALTRSIEALNADPALHKRLTIETARVPPEMGHGYAVERHPALPGYPPEYHREFGEWLLAKRAITRMMPYEDLVDVALSREAARGMPASSRKS